jgi:hypothetical protein
MMLTENEKKEHIKQANIRWRTRQPEAFKKTIGKWNRKHPNYMKEWNKKHPNYLKEWKSRNKEKQRQYREIWNKKHPNYMKDYMRDYMKDYMKEWNKKHPNHKKDYLKEWNKKHPNYMKDWKSNMKGINAGSTLKIEGVDLAVVSEPDKSIYREIDET